MKPTDPTDPTAPTTAELVKPILDKFERMLTELEDVARKDDDWGKWCGADWSLNHATREELVKLHSWAERQTEFSRESVCDVVDVSIFGFNWDADFARGFVEGSLLMWESVRAEIYRLASQVEQQQAKIAERPLSLAERIRLCTAWGEAKDAAQLAIAAAKRAHDAWMDAEGGRLR